MIKIIVPAPNFTIICTFYEHAQIWSSFIQIRWPIIRQDAGMMSNISGDLDIDNNAFVGHVAIIIVQKEDI